MTDKKIINTLINAEIPEIAEKVLEDVLIVPSKKVGTALGTIIMAENQDNFL